MHMNLKRWLAVLAVGGLALAACVSGPTAAKGALLPGISQASLDAVKAEIDKYTGLPEFIPPGPPFDTSKVRGKTVFNIPDSTANPFAVSIAKGEGEAAKLLGINYISCSDQGLVSQWAQCFGQAVQRKVGLINDFGGVDPRVVGPQIHAAQKTGIPVVATHVYGYSQTPLYVNTSIPAPYEEAGRLMADWVVLDTGGQTDVLVVVSNEVLGTPPIVAGLRDVFGKYCPTTCHLTFVNVPVSDWSTKIQPEVQVNLTRNPRINYIIPIYDSMSQFVVPAITASGRVGKVFISTFNGTPFVLGYMETGKIVRMDIGENLDWVGWAIMDADARVLAGEHLPMTFDGHFPLRVFTKQNVEQAGVPPQLSTGYGNAYRKGYQKLWGKP
jgi:ribose transport system substrate-binding protein